MARRRRQEEKVVSRRRLFIGGETPGQLPNPVATAIKLNRRSENH
jgi:hypothetical protein